MKKFLISLICFNLAIFPCLALDINDEFVETSLDKDLRIKSFVSTNISDDFAIKNNAKNHPISTNSLIEDKFAERNTNKSVNRHQVVISETLPKLTKSDENIRRAVFDYSNNAISIPIKAVTMISTKAFPEEGSYVEFETAKDTVIKGKVYPKGTKVLGRVETVSMNFSLGVPADITIGNFRLGNEIIHSEIHKTGANRSIWVKPCSYVGLCFFGLGVLLMPIRGGHAKICPEEVFTIYYR